MAAAVLGIYGNSKQEAMYPAYLSTRTGSRAGRRQPLHHPLRAGPVAARQRLLVADHVRMPASLLFANPLNRYLINSPMLPKFKRDADGGLTLYLQNESPGRGQGSELAARARGPF